VEELVKAAEAEVEVSSLRTGWEIVECLQTLSRNIQAMKEERATDSQSSRDKISSKLENLHQAMMSNSQAIKVLRDEIALQTKLQRLDFAYRNSSVGAFEYRTNDFRSYGNTWDLIPEIILSFRKGFGRYINGWGTSHYSEESEAKAAEFHSKLSDQIETLTGVKPCIEQESSGKYSIHYS